MNEKTNAGLLRAWRQRAATSSVHRLTGSVVIAVLVSTIILAGPTVGSARGAGLLIAENGFGGVLTIEQQDVKVTINNGIAVTRVEQVFRNTENRIVEALYTFPVPKGASVSNFSMWINGREMIGEVVEKERARQIYESYKQKRRDPGLLEQVDYKRFEMRIFPIPAGAEQRVMITYAQELNYDHDTATYVYPLATVTTPSTMSQKAGRISLSLEAKSEVPIVKMTSPSHVDEFAMAQHTGEYWQASLELPDGDLSRDVVVVYQMRRPHTGIDLVASKQTGEDGYFLLTMTAGKELEGTSFGSDYVFVLDVSGSMRNDSKLSMSRGSLEHFIGALGDKDKVELITFNIRPTALFDKLQQVSEEVRAQAAEFLKSQRAVGGTVLRPALETAYRYHNPDRPLNVVIVSDGMTEQTEQAELVRLIGQRPSGVTVFCVGVGNEINRPLLTQLANDAGGLAAFISTSDDFQRQAQAFRRKLTRPAAKQVELTFDGGQVYDLEPRVLPNLYFGQPIRLYGRYRGSGPVQVRVQAEIQGSPLDQQVALELPANDASNPQIDRMWASHRVSRLQDEQRAAGVEKHVNDIVQLCEGYSIASPYASFLVLENDAEYKRWQIARRNATRVQRDRKAQAALRRQLDELRRQSTAQLGPQEPEATFVSSKSNIAVDSPQQQPATTRSPSAPSSNIDLDTSPSSGGGGGGGAIDPLTALLGIGLASLGFAAQQRSGVRRVAGEGKALRPADTRRPRPPRL